MPRRCTICYHANRNEIDSALSDNVEYGKIRSKYGVSHKALASHLKNHLQPIINKANAKAEQAIVDKILTFREEVNYSPLEKIKLAQHRILNDLDSASDINERITIIREFRGWFQEEAKITGEYTKDKENPKSYTDQELAQELYRRLITKLDKESAIEGVKQYYPNANIQDITNLIN